MHGHFTIGKEQTFYSEQLMIFCFHELWSVMK